MNEPIQTITANIARCMQSSNGVGHTVFYNVCSGTHTEVPWGSLDWVAFGFGTAFVVSGVAALGAVAVAIYKESY